MSGDTFTRDRFTWLEALTADARLHSSAIRVAIVISSHLNRGSGEAWPSIKTIAEKSATPERTVERAVSELCKAGYLEKRRGGFGKSNRYVMSGGSSPETNPQQTDSEAKGGTSGFHSPAMGGGYGPVSPAMDGGNDDAIPAMDGGSFPPWVADHSRHGWRTNPLIEPSEIEPIEVDISPPAPSCAKPGKAKGREEDSGFEEFYGAFPRKVAKGTARKAWAKAVKLASPGTIIQGARRYATERQHEDPRFTKHPATWLNAEGWNDEAAPAQQLAPVSAGGRGTAKERTAAAVRHILARNIEPPPPQSPVDALLEVLGGADDAA